MNWKYDYHWDLGKATLTCLDVPMMLKWEGEDPWRFTIGEETLGTSDFPWIHAEDSGLAIRYAEKYHYDQEK